MIITFYPRQLIVAIYDALKEEFPKEHVLYVELDSVITGFQNSLCWSALRNPNSSVENPINTIIVESSFESEWMPRPEIVDRIANTSGLNQTMSASCLKAIETMISRAMAEADVVVLEPICTLRRAEEGRYELELNGPFRVQPYKGMADDNASPSTASAAAASAGA